MLMWINLMTQESHIKSKVTDVISRKLATPSPSESPTEQNGSKQVLGVVSFTIKTKHPRLIPHFLKTACMVPIMTQAIRVWVVSAFQIVLRLILLDPLQDLVTITSITVTSCIQTAL